MELTFAKHEMGSREKSFFKPIELVNEKVLPVNEPQIEAKTHGEKVRNEVLDIMNGLNNALTGPNEVKGIFTDSIDIIYRQFNMRKYSHSIKNMNKIVESFQKDKDFNKFMVKSRIDDALVTKRQKELTEIVANEPSLTDKKAYQAELDKINTYLSARLLVRINQEKMFRSGLSSGIKVVNVAGNVAIVLRLDNKVFAIMRDAAEKSVYAVKAVEIAVKTGRDKADEEKSPEWLKKIFDPNESSQKRIERQEKCADFIMNLYENMPDRSKWLSFEERKQVKYAENFVVAAGCNLREFKYSNGKHFEQKKILTEYMKKEM